ncbi:helix-turn-helix domain-containing protein [Kribbella sp. NPDC059898]|uniref:helix-turn-helix domain-containing protein n=1 Tax=Kribbella sp. NPDC059898 TaxID=3346995 RepID=UPI0036535D4C
MLEGLGIDATQEQLYEHVLTHPGLTAVELVHAHPDTPVVDTLADLVARHFLRVTDGRYTAVPPELALQGMLDTRQLELDRAAARVQQLERLHRATPDPLRQAPVEVVPGDQAPAYGLALHSATRSEIRAFETPPYGKRLVPADTKPVTAAIHRGVRHRIVYSRDAVDEQGLDMLRETLTVGEQARVVGDVPVRLAIYDDKVATMPAVTGRPVTEGLLVIRPSSLLDGLIALFERVWASAPPLTLDTAPRGDQLDPDDDRTLIALLAAGMGDQAIARQLGISLRTVGRRVQRVQSTLNAATRFQAGLALGLSRSDN